MLKALRHAGRVTFGSVALTTNAALITQNQCHTLLSEGTPNVRIVNGTFLMPGDKRPKDHVYQNERIPTSRFFDIDEVADKSVNLPHMIPSMADWSDHMRRLDIGVNDIVICYDDYGVVGSSRVWWTMKLFGVQNCWIMNSNLEKWKKEGYEVETGSPKWKGIASMRSSKDFEFKFNGGLMKDIRDVKRWMEAHEKEYELVDARSPGRFAGTEPDPRGLESGHIPGAKNLFFKTLLDETMCFKSEEEIAKMIKGANVDLRKELWFSCGSGVTASVLHAGAYQVGLQKCSVYDGSWSEWASDRANPIAQIRKDA